MILNHIVSNEGELTIEEIYEQVGCSPFYLLLTGRSTAFPARKN